MIKSILTVIALTVLTVSNAFALSNCQVKYDGHPRALPSLKGMCNVCHLNVNGSGPQNEFGRAFANNGFKITDELVAKFPDFFQKQPEGPALPTIQRIKPKKVKVNVPSMILIMGKNFVSDSKAFIDNNEVLTTFKSNVLLIVDFILSSVGLHDLKVKNPDGQESNTKKIKAK